jgi:hypothetical protein
MAFVPDPILILNLLLCIIILIMGCAIYGKRSDVNALMIGIAFGLFGVSHLYTLLGSTFLPAMAFADLRICGYILVAAALFLYFRD